MLAQELLILYAYIQESVITLKLFENLKTYRTALVPEALVAVIPHSEASAPGSMGNHNPVSLMYALSAVLVTPGLTVQ